MGFVVGVIGAGQLARMMIGPAVELGVELRVFAESDGAPAGLAATQVGDYTDIAEVLRFADGVDAVTFDHEHVPQRVLRALEDAGVAVRPGSAALRFAQDKLAMRRLVAELGLPQPDWAAVRSAEQLDAFLDGHGGHAVVKTPVGGYDGHGVRFVGSSQEVEDWLGLVADSGDAALLVEETVAFSRELSQLSARRPSGEFACWELAESVQRGGICVEVCVPASGAGDRLRSECVRIARTIAEHIGVVGVLAVELFETPDGRVLINELAMRPHNTGHWTMDGALTGQFEQHVRAVLDLPLGAPGLRGSAAAMVNVLGGPEQAELAGSVAAALAADPDAKLHWYGKEHRAGRKVGHVTVVLGRGRGEEAVARARAVARVLRTDAPGAEDPSASA